METEDIMKEIGEMGLKYPELRLSLNDCLIIILIKSIMGGEK